MAPANSKFQPKLLIFGIIIIIIIVLLVIKMLYRRRPKIQISSREEHAKYLAKEKEARILTGMGNRNITIPDPLPNLLYVPEIATWKERLFPYQIKDILLGDVSYFETNQHYPKLTELLKPYPQTPTPEDLRFLLQYKTFLESKDLYSTAGPDEIDQLYVLMLKVFGKRVAGDFVECGLWRGGMLMFLKAATEHYRKMGLDVVSERKFWGFDAFGKFPPPGKNGLDNAIHPLNSYLYENASSRNEVASYFQKHDLMDERVELREGDFAISLARATELSAEDRLARIALLRIDCDYYDATMLCLEYLYPLVSKGGFVVVDDYNNPVFGCRQAVDDFRKMHGISSPLVDPYGGSVYWVV